MNYKQRISNICINIAKSSTVEMENDSRKILDASLTYLNRPSEIGAEYQERDLMHIMVNNIRHCHSSYENGLRSLHNANRYAPVGMNESMYYRYKNAILNKIAEVYPFLSKQCNEQKRSIKMVKLNK